MPMYEYECEECGNCKTIRRSVADRDITVLCLEHGGDADCLTFNAPRMKRVVSRHSTG
jgi:putative FmdB family regulatory protein